MVGKKALGFVGLAALGLVAGCGNPTVTTLDGSSSNPTPSDTPPPSTPPPGPAMAIGLALAPNFSLDLRDSKDVGFTVTSFNHFVGDVTVTITGLPAGLSAANPSASVTLTDNGTATGKITVKSDNTVIAPGSIATGVSVGAVAVSDSTIKDTQTLPITINPVITIMTNTTAIPTGGTAATGTCSLWDPAGDFTVSGTTCVGKGTEVHWGNATKITVQWSKQWSGETHRVHGNGTSASGQPLLQLGGTSCNQGSATEDACGGLVHSDGNALSPSGNSSEDTSGKAATKPFIRVLATADNTKTSTVDFYDHANPNGKAGNTVGAYPGRITLEP